MTLEVQERIRNRRKGVNVKILIKTNKVVVIALIDWKP